MNANDKPRTDAASKVVDAVNRSKVWSDDTVAAWVSWAKSAPVADVEWWAAAAGSVR